MELPDSRDVTNKTWEPINYRANQGKQGSGRRVRHVAFVKGHEEMINIILLSFSIVDGWRFGWVYTELKRGSDRK